MVRGTDDEGGQVSALAALVVALMLVMAVGIASLGTIVIERQSATIAADAAALAGAAGAPDLVADWYRDRGIEVAVDDGRSDTRVGNASARSAALGGDELRVAPAVVAVLARAEQLLGHELQTVELAGVAVVLGEPSASRLAEVADELGLCEMAEATEHRRFALC